MGHLNGSRVPAMRHLLIIFKKNVNTQGLPRERFEVVDALFTFDGLGCSRAGGSYTG